MEPKDWPIDPLDRTSAAALVVRLVEELDASSEEQRDDLLCELLYAGWGSLGAQNQ